MDNFLFHPRDPALEALRYGRLPKMPIEYPDRGGLWRSGFQRRNTRLSWSALNQSDFEGRWQAITGLALGYPVGVN